MTDRLSDGDDLEVPRRQVAAASVERVRLDPPFDGDAIGDLEGSRAAARDPRRFRLCARARIGVLPRRGGRRGAGTGLVGRIDVEPDRRTGAKAIAGADGVRDIGVPMVRDLGHRVEREGDRTGFVPTLGEPTRPMRTRATGGGFHEAEALREVPHPRILAVEGRLAGSRRDLPAGDASELGKARREDTGGERREERLGAPRIGPQRVAGHPLGWPRTSAPCVWTAAPASLKIEAVAGGSP